MITFATLENSTTSDILTVFNSAFADYLIPFHLKLDQLESKLNAEDIDLAYSVGAFVDNELVGFILHGVRVIDGKKIVYNGGTGVNPNQRGHGIAKKMYQFIMPKLKMEHVDQLVLEVISNNTPAIKSYEQIGYKIVRELPCYKGSITDLKSVNPIEVKEVENYNWELMQSFWDVQPSWQNSKEAIIKMGKVIKLIGAFNHGTLIGYVFLNSTNNRLQQIAVDRKYRKQKVASSIIKFITNKYGSNTSQINVDKSSEQLNSFLQYIGMENFLNQYEMKMDL